SIKIKPTFIYQFKNPRILQGVNKDELPVFYYNNSTAWMTSLIWNEFLTQLNQQMVNENRFIILLYDQAS
ncbi:2807_t:CDS:1, partial [Scutellospora calospora]